MHETLLPGSRIALRTTDHAETQKLAISRPRPGDPLTLSRFRPPDSVRRRVGRPLFEGGDLTPGFSEPAQRGRECPFTRAVWPLPRWQGGHNAGGVLPPVSGPLRVLPPVPGLGSDRGVFQTTESLATMFHKPADPPKPTQTFSERGLHPKRLIFLGVSGTLFL